MCVNGFDRRDGDKNIHTHKYIHTYTRILNTSPMVEEIFEILPSGLSKNDLKMDN
jgi:hypothetical protein